MVSWMLHFLEQVNMVPFGVKIQNTQRIQTNTIAARKHLLHRYKVSLTLATLMKLHLHWGTIYSEAIEWYWWWCLSFCTLTLASTTSRIAHMRRGLVRIAYICWKRSVWWTVEWRLMCVDMTMGPPVVCRCSNDVLLHMYRTIHLFNVEMSTLSLSRILTND